MRCLILDWSEKREQIRDSLTGVDALSEIDVLDGPVTDFDRLLSYHVIVVTDPEDELLFFGMEVVPWVIVTVVDYSFTFIPNDRILFMPKCDSPRIPNS